MLAIFSDIRSNRLKYTLDFICKEHIKCGYTLYNNTEEYANAEGIKINYSVRNMAGLQIKPSPEIWAEGIDLDLKPTIEFVDDLFVQFIQNSVLGFDPFAMAFYNLSRYKEYQVHKKDKHGRFMAINDLENTVAVYQRPYVDLALDYMCSILGIEPKHSFSSVPTLDIDMAYMYAGKIVTRRINSWLRDPLKWNSIGNFLWNNPKSDPYALNWKYLDWPNLHIFFLYGEYGMYDKNIRIGYKSFKKLIRKCSEKACVGLHPSYLGNELEDKWQEEKANFEKTLGKRVLHSRQHYIMLEFGTKSTYKQLLEMGIEHDFSMGYTDDIGFRAGTSLPFKWFNLQSNLETHLTIHPFSFMDVILKNTKQYSPQEAAERLEQLKKECKKWNVPFSGIFHNESLSNYGNWKGWNSIFEQVFEQN